jgi:hypothetical protein
VRHIYEEAENQILLNAYTYIQLEIFSEIRLDRFQQSVNQVDGVSIEDYNTKTDKVTFNIDRISLSQITNIVEKYESATGVNMYSDTMRVTSKMVTEGRFSGLNTVARGKALNPVVSIEIPSTTQDYLDFIMGKTQYDIKEQEDQSKIITQPVEDVLLSTPSKEYVPFPMNLYRNTQGMGEKELLQSNIYFNSYVVRDIR